MEHLTDLPPLGKPLYIQTYIPSATEIRTQSVLQVETPDDLNSNKFGVSEWSLGCETCDNLLDECPGHSGSLELPIPIYLIFFVKRLISTLNCICFYCQRLRLPKSDKRYQWIRNLEPKKRLEYLEKYSKSYKYCGMDIKGDTKPCVDQKLQDTLAKDIHHECHKMFVQFRNEDRDCTFVRAVIRLDEADFIKYKANPKWRPMAIGPQDIYDCLSHLSDETKEMMGCDEFNDPVNLMWSVLSVPSLNTRPCHTFAGVGNGKKRIFNDWTKLLRNIVVARNELRETMKKSSERVTCCHYVYNDVESRNFTECFQYGHLEKKKRDPVKKRLKAELKKTNFGAVENCWRNLHKNTAGFHSHRHKKFIQKGSYGKPLMNLEERFGGQKAGRFRGYVTGRRVNQAGRAVLEGHYDMEVDVAGIPKKEAMNVTVKAFVNKLNLRQVKKWILNGPFEYPGANYVTMRTTGEEINLAYHENRRDINPEDVMFVRRHLMDNDLVLVGRQPTLHKPSMMTFRARIVEGYTILLHYAVFPPLGADCDGDEVNFQVLQTLEAFAEAREICCVKNNIMKDGKIWIKFILSTVIGAHLMTRPENLSEEPGIGTLLTESQVSFITSMLDIWELPIPLYGQARTDSARWSGHQLISLILPPDFTLISKDLVIEHGKFLRGQLSDQALNGNGGVLHHLYRDYQDREVTMKFLHQGYILFQRYLDLFGHSAGYFDCAIDFHHKDEALLPNADPVMRDCLQRLDQVQLYFDRMNEYSDTLPQVIPDVHDAVTENNLRDHIDKLTNMSTEAVVKYHEWVNAKNGNQNGLLSMIKSGAKGSTSTLNQMCGIVGQIYVMYRRFPQTSSHFLHGKGSAEAYGCIRQSYSCGLPLPAVVVEAHSTCESVVNKNKGTSKSGYTIRKLTTCMMGVVIDYKHRAVDTHNRVIWPVYGNDGYDPQRMLQGTLHLLANSIDFYQLPTLPEAPSFDRGTWVEWCSVRELVATRELLQQECVELDGLKKHLTTLLSRCSDPLAMQFTRAPFDFEHLFQRCAHRPIDGPKLLDMHPVSYRIFATHLWNRLLQNKLVVPFNLTFKAIFMHWMSTKMLMTYGFTAADLKWLTQEMTLILGRSIIEPGESVGVNATQNTGEPFAQLTLKTPHFSGKFSNVVGGTVRIANIIDSNFCNPQMRIILKASVTAQTQANIFGLSLNRSYLKDIVSSHPTITFPPRTDTCQIYIPIDKGKTIDRLISLRSAVKTLCNLSAMELNFFETTFMDSLGDWFIRITCPLKSKFWKNITEGLQMKQIDDAVVAENIVYNLCNSVVIHGVPTIENFISEEIQIQTPRGPETRWAITTLGSNLRYVLRLPEVDTERTVSNNVTEMGEVFGLLAARKSLEQEFLEVLPGSMVDARHIKMIARFMASDLEIKGMKIKQMAQNIQPLQRAAYEQGIKQTIDYCADGEKDYGKTICGGVLLNKPLLVGTGYNLEMIPAPQAVPSDSLVAKWQAIPDHLTNYVFSPKADGIRYFFVFFRDRNKHKIAALVDRTNTVYTLPTAQLPEALFHGTVIDGELIHNKVFMAFDCLMICGNRSAGLRYDQRVELAREVVFRLSAGESGESAKLGEPFLVGATAAYCLPICLRPETSTHLIEAGELPFALFVKPIFDMSGLAHFIEHRQPLLPFGCDGYIFTNLSDPAMPFRMNPTSIFKFKPRDDELNHNTIDFLVMPLGERSDELPSISFYLGSSAWKYELSPVSFDTMRSRRPKPNHNCLLAFYFDGNLVYFSYGVVDDISVLPVGPTDAHTFECHWNYRLQTWQVGRARNKDHNQLETVVKTVQNIIENISPSELS